MAISALLVESRMLQGSLAGKPIEPVGAAWQSPECEFAPLPESRMLLEPCGGVQKSQWSPLEVSRFRRSLAGRV